MTCRHCLVMQDYKLSMVSVKFWDGKIMPARVGYTDEIYDIGLLQLEERVDVPVIKYKLKLDTKIGDFVIMLGSGEGFHHTALAGILCHKNQYFNPCHKSYGNFEFLQIASVAPPGISGGLLIDQSGAGIGMMLQGLDPFGFAIPLGVVLNTITKYFKPRKEHLSLQFKQTGVLPDYDMSINLFKFSEQEYVSSFQRKNTADSRSRTSSQVSPLDSFAIDDEEEEDDV